IERLDAIQDFESEVHGADGTRRWITENVRVIRDGEGRIVRLQGFVTDVSERKRFEHVLAEERERLAVTLGAMTEGVITTDRAGVVQFINEAAELMTGWSSGSAVGHRLADVCTLRHERTKADVPLPFDVAMTNAAPVDLPRSVQIVDRHGTARLVEGRCAPIHNFHSRPVGVVLVLRDTGERSRLEAERLRTSKLESLGVLAGGIAHDFNNLLTVVLGNVSLAQLDRGVARAAGRWLKDAEIAAVRARELTQQLLTFARGGDPVRTAVRVPEVVREAAEFALHGSSVRCEYHLPPDLWPADIDRGQIGQVVQNLVINGVQAMPDGGVIRISIANVKHPGDPVGTIAPGTYLRLEIADEGGGIRSENLSRIFDPYFTTKATGSGLGLAMVYSIIKKHEGHIEVDSEVGRGTTFKIHLPAVPTAQPVPTTPEAAPERMSGRVLFMDDEESIRRMATALLERLGLSVTVVDDGRALLHEYRNAQQIGRPYDVVLMDLTVPGGMGGREAMEALRRIDPEVKAVVSSGYSSDPVLANYRAHGFRGRVAKPYRATDLARTLQEVLTTSSDLTGVREVRSTVA
ncbi:MAG TPA: ATP-binding protein, partial [Candidatus Synoicihabitans sp.]|nr:ATP-binding protein [Candidatus Synoicihabitans sp.]